MIDATTGPPDAGYIRIPSIEGNAFLDHVAEIWGKIDSGVVVLGFRVSAHHCNSRGHCHGGMLLTFCDMFLPNIARLSRAAEDCLTPTVSMTANFLAPAKLGSWLEARAHVLRQTRSLLFVEGAITNEAQPIVQVSGIFKRRTSGGKAAGATGVLQRLHDAERPQQS